MKTNALFQAVLLLTVVSVLSLSCQKEELIIPGSLTAVPSGEVPVLSGVSPAGPWMASGMETVDMGDPAWEQGPTLEPTDFRVEELDESHSNLDEYGSGATINGITSGQAAWIPDVNPE